MIDRRQSLALLATLTAQGAAHAQDTYPKGPIRFVVPYPPGGPTDLMARLLQPEMQKRLDVPVIIENKGGAGGNIGSAEVAKQAPADGQTILLAASGPMAVNGSLYKSMPFNALTDLAPVAQLSAFPLVMEVHPSVDVATVKEFIAKAKAQKEPFIFASAGSGTPQHLAGELFARAAGVHLVHAPYRGAGPALNDLLGGQVKLMFDIMASSLPYIQAGRLKPLAVTSSSRSPALPKVPTMAEAGLPNFETTAWHGMAVRAGTPQAIVARLNATVLDIFNDPRFRKKWEALGTPVVAGTPEDFGRLVRTNRFGSAAWCGRPARQRTERTCDPPECIASYKKHGLGDQTVRRLFAALIVALAGASQAQPPARSEWNFVVRLDGRTIGTHRFVVTGDPADTASVTSDASFDVRLLGFSAYRYEHRAAERWANNCLAAIDATTDDDGRVTKVHGPPSAPVCVMSFAYWNAALPLQHQLLDPGTGRIVDVTITRLPDAEIDTDRGILTAQGWRIAGLPQPIDLRWAEGRWVGLDTFVSGKHLSYRLR